MTYSHNKKRTKAVRNGGFVALFATLIASVILILVIGATRIAYKELLLSSSARESERAFFAADTGVECGLYLDRIGNAFPPAADTDFSCGDVHITIDFGDPSLFDVPISTTSCARVSVDKTYDSDGDGTEESTQVVAKGYNVSCDNVDLTSVSRKVERKLEVTYLNPVIPEEPLPEGGAV